MKVLAVFAILFVSTHAGSVLPTTFISRAPAFDSAVIKSDRFGGNFAYSVAETHAYAAHTPVQTLAAAAPFSYAAGGVTYAAPSAVTYASPVLPTYGGLPVAYAAPSAPIARLL